MQLKMVSKRFSILLALSLVLDAGVRAEPHEFSKVKSTMKECVRIVGKGAVAGVSLFVPLDLALEYYKHVQDRNRLARALELTRSEWAALRQSQSTQASEIRDLLLSKLKSETYGEILGVKTAPHSLIQLTRVFLELLPVKALSIYDNEMRKDKNREGFAMGIFGNPPRGAEKAALEKFQDALSGAILRNLRRGSALVLETPRMKQFNYLVVFHGFQMAIQVDLSTKKILRRQIMFLNLDEVRNRALRKEDLVSSAHLPTPPMGILRGLHQAADDVAERMQRMMTPSDDVNLAMESESPDTNVFEGLGLPEDVKFFLDVQLHQHPGTHDFLLEISFLLAEDPTLIEDAKFRTALAKALKKRPQFVEQGMQFYQRERIRLEHYLDKPGETAPTESSVKAEAKFEVSVPRKVEAMLEARPSDRYLEDFHALVEAMKVYGLLADRVTGGQTHRGLNRLQLTTGSYKTRRTGWKHYHGHLSPSRAKPTIVVGFWVKESDPHQIEFDYYGTHENVPWRD